MWAHEWVHDDEYVPIPFKLKGVGIGHAKSGKRQSWTKKPYFDTDLLVILEKKMSLRKFKARFIHTPSEVRWFFKMIQARAVRPLETPAHARNKLLLYLDRFHNCLSGEQMSDKYQIGCKTAYDHCSDIVQAILSTYADKNPISFPTMQERPQMVSILKLKKRPAPTALFSVDGSDLRCTGRHIAERRSRKYRWLPCFKITAVIERVLGTVCAVNVEPASTVHDIKTLRQAAFFQDIEKTMSGWIILSDKGVYT